MLGCGTAVIGPKTANAKSGTAAVVDALKASIANPLGNGVGERELVLA